VICGLEAQGITEIHLQSMSPHVAAALVREGLPNEIKGPDGKIIPEILETLLLRAGGAGASLALAAVATPPMAVLAFLQGSVSPHGVGIELAVTGKATRTNTLGS
jgi:hypothetical protein